jgi:hypothetical protein
MTAGQAQPHADPLRVSALWRDGRGRAVAAALVVLTAVVAVLLDEPTDVMALVPFTAVPVAVLAVALALTLLQGTTLAAGALMLAVTPAPLAAVAASDPAGALAVLAACGALAVACWGDRVPSATAAIGLCVVVFALGAWVAATDDSPGPAPAVGRIVTRTGELLWRSVGALDDATLVPTTGWLIWWVAAGLLVGAAIVAGDTVSALLVPLAAAAMVAAGWFLIRWHGDVDISNGTWILSSAVAFTGASVRLEPAHARRIGNVLLVIAAYIWMVTIVHLART